MNFYIEQDAMRKPFLMQGNKRFGSFLLIPSILIYELILIGASIRQGTWYSGVDKRIGLLEKELGSGNNAGNCVVEATVEPQLTASSHDCHFFGGQSIH